MEVLESAHEGESQCHFTRIDFAAVHKGGKSDPCARMGADQSTEVALLDGEARRRECMRVSLAMMSRLHSK